MRKKGSAHRSVLALCRGGIIAAMYVGLTFAVAPIAFGPIQFRLSEMLTILPVFLPEAIPALYIGCLISNLIGQAAIWDVIFGSLATLIGAVGAYLLRRLPLRIRWLATLPTILSNALIVPLVLIYAYGVPDAYLFLVGTVGLGEVVCAGVGGAVLMYTINKTKIFTS